MPVYEFYCADCHAVFNFLARRVSTDKTPSCPRCKRQGLEKQVSAFAISRNLEEPQEGMPDIDESKIEQAMMNLLHNAIKFTPVEGSITVSARAGISPCSTRCWEPPWKEHWKGILTVK